MSNDTELTREKVLQTAYDVAVESHNAAALLDLARELDRHEHLRAENEELLAVIERYLEAATSGGDARPEWDALVQTVW